ncbi:MAG: iron-sulfur cluster assembly accessory protein [Actinomycetota bacterium]|nr:iron-sulfur cluster assembly accessory protein [Actinomycetota bacterium]
MTVKEPAAKTVAGVVLTPDAVVKVRELMDVEGDPDLALRLSARPGGCSGFRYDLHFDTRIDPTDRVSETDGVRLIVDQGSVEALAGATVDFRDLGIKGAGFAIENPNETAHECGCGRAD